ncbi:hypothetical protein KIL84_010376 [Mauremys mutica]|uniref:Uncharacterized protein n=1 Tax=Mauremys mutica TaxID=74926 RepID=A0A9D3XA02_9SAUR|nr:hypothetical protein KIL84_010376 [Mauremys mutica]
MHCISGCESVLDVGKEIQMLRVTSANDVNMLRLTGHQLCHTELLKCNRTANRVEGKPSVTSVLERCINPAQDYMSNSSEIHLLLTCTTKHANHHQSNIALKIDNHMKEQKFQTDFNEYMNLQTNLICKVFHPQLLVAFQTRNQEPLNVL